MAVVVVNLPRSNFTNIALYSVRIAATLACHEWQNLFVMYKIAGLFSNNIKQSENLTIIVHADEVIWLFFYKKDL